jgi:hypothetical protein
MFAGSVVLRIKRCALFSLDLSWFCVPVMRSGILDILSSVSYLFPCKANGCTGPREYPISSGTFSLVVPGS